MWLVDTRHAKHLWSSSSIKSGRHLVYFCILSLLNVPVNWRLSNMSCNQTAFSDEAYPVDDGQAPHIQKLSAKFNAHFLRDQQGGLDIWIDILSHELLPSLQNEIASEFGPGRTIYRAWRQNLYLRQVTSLNLKAVEAAVNVFHKVHKSLRKQVEHNLYRIRESATSELIQRTLCNILAIDLGNRIRIDEQLEDFRLKHF